MRQKSNQLLLGLLLLITGIFMLFKPGLGRGVLFVSLAAAGGAFILLYRTKRKIWALVAGIYLAYLGVGGLLAENSGGFFSLAFIGAMFFIVPAVVFLVLYFERNKRYLLIPSCMMLCFGLFIFLKDFNIFRYNAVMLFFLCLAGGFLMLFVIGRCQYGKWPLISSAVCIVLGLLFRGGLGLTSAFFDNLSAVAAALFISAAAVIILRALKNK